MHERSLPSFPDLSSFLAHLDRDGAVRNVDSPVSMHLEATEIHGRVIARGGPVLRFRAPLTGGRPSPMPAVANLFGTVERVAAGLGTNREGLATSAARLPGCVRRGRLGRSPKRVRFGL